MTSTPLLRLSLRPTSTAVHHRSLTPLPFPLKPPTLNLSIPKLHKPQKTLKISNSFNPSSTPSITPFTDRLISAASYCLPFFNSLQYGRFLLTQYPSLALIFEPILPLFGLYRSVPYASFVTFFGLYLGVVRNEYFSRYVRFNAMQALVLDVLLAVPLLVQRIFTPGRQGLGFKLMVMGHNAIFVFLVFCFVYSVVFSILGKTPYLPFVADAAGRQL